MRFLFEDDFNVRDVIFSRKNNDFTYQFGKLHTLLEDHFSSFDKRPETETDKCLLDPFVLVSSGSIMDDGNIANKCNLCNMVVKEVFDTESDGAHGVKNLKKAPAESNDFIKKTSQEGIVIENYSENPVVASSPLLLRLNFQIFPFQRYQLPRAYSYCSCVQNPRIDKFGNWSISTVGNQWRYDDYGQWVASNSMFILDKICVGREPESEAEKNDQTAQNTLKLKEDGVLSVSSWMHCDRSKVVFTSVDEDYLIMKAEKIRPDVYGDEDPSANVEGQDQDHLENVEEENVAPEKEADEEAENDNAAAAAAGVTEGEEGIADEEMKGVVGGGEGDVALGKAEKQDGEVTKDDARAEEQQTVDENTAAENSSSAEQNTTAIDTAEGSSNAGASGTNEGASTVNAQDGTDGSSNAAGKVNGESEKGFGEGPGETHHPTKEENATAINDENAELNDSAEGDDAAEEEQDEDSVKQAKEIKKMRSVKLAIPNFNYHYNPAQLVDYGYRLSSNRSSSIVQLDSSAANGEELGNTILGKVQDQLLKLDKKRNNGQNANSSDTDTALTLAAVACFFRKYETAWGLLSLSDSLKEEVLERILKGLESTTEISTVGDGSDPADSGSLPYGLDQIIEKVLFPTDVNANAAAGSLYFCKTLKTDLSLLNSISAIRYYEEEAKIAAEAFIKKLARTGIKINSNLATGAQNFITANVGSMASLISFSSSNESSKASKLLHHSSSEKAKQKAKSAGLLPLEKKLFELLQRFFNSIKLPNQWQCYINSVFPEFDSNDKFMEVYGSDEFGNEITPPLELVMPLFILCLLYQLPQLGGLQGLVEIEDSICSRMEEKRRSQMKKSNDLSAEGNVDVIVASPQAENKNEQPSHNSNRYPVPFISKDTQEILTPGFDSWGKAGLYSDDTEYEKFGVFSELYGCGRYDKRSLWHCFCGPVKTGVPESYTISPSHRIGKLCPSCVKFRNRWETLNLSSGVPGCVTVGESRASSSSSSSSSSASSSALQTAQKSSNNKALIAISKSEKFALFRAAKERIDYLHAIDMAQTIETMYDKMHNLQFGTSEVQNLSELTQYISSDEYLADYSSRTTVVGKLSIETVASGSARGQSEAPVPTPTNIAEMLTPIEVVFCSFVLLAQPTEYVGLVRMCFDGVNGASSIKFRTKTSSSETLNAKSLTILIMELLKQINSFFQKDIYPEFMSAIGIVKDKSESSYLGKFDDQSVFQTRFLKKLRPIERAITSDMNNKEFLEAKERTRYGVVEVDAGGGCGGGFYDRSMLSLRDWDMIMSVVLVLFSGGIREVGVATGVGTSMGGETSVDSVNSAPQTSSLYFDPDFSSVKTVFAPWFALRGRWVSVTNSDSNRNSLDANDNSSSCEKQTSTRTRPHKAKVAFVRNSMWTSLDDWEYTLKMHDSVMSSESSAKNYEKPIMPTVVPSASSPSVSSTTQNLAYGDSLWDLWLTYCKVFLKEEVERVAERKERKMKEEMRAEKEREKRERKGSKQQGKSSKTDVTSTSLSPNKTDAQRASSKSPSDLRPSSKSPSELRPSESKGADKRPSESKSPSVRANSKIDSITSNTGLINKVDSKTERLSKAALGSASKTELDRVNIAVSPTHSIASSVAAPDQSQNEQERHQGVADKFATLAHKCMNSDRPPSAQATSDSKNVEDSSDAVGIIWDMAVWIWGFVEWWDCLEDAMDFGETASSTSDSLSLSSSSPQPIYPLFENISKVEKRSEDAAFFESLKVVIPLGPSGSSPEEQSTMNATESTGMNAYSQSVGSAVGDHNNIKTDRKAAKKVVPLTDEEEDALAERKESVNKACDANLVQAVEEIRASDGVSQLFMKSSPSDPIPKGNKSSRSASSSSSSTGEVFANAGFDKVTTALLSAVAILGGRPNYTYDVLDTGMIVEHVEESSSSAASDSDGGEKYLADFEDEDHESSTSEEEEDTKRSEAVEQAVSEKLNTNAQKKAADISKKKSVGKEVSSGEVTDSKRLASFRELVGDQKHFLIGLEKYDGIARKKRLENRAEGRNTLLKLKALFDLHGVVFAPLLEIKRRLLFRKTAMVGNLDYLERDYIGNSVADEAAEEDDKDGKSSTKAAIFATNKGFLQSQLRAKVEQKNSLVAKQLLEDLKQEFLNQLLIQMCTTVDNSADRKKEEKFWKAKQGLVIGLGKWVFTVLHCYFTLRTVDEHYKGLLMSLRGWKEIQMPLTISTVTKAQTEGVLFSGPQSDQTAVKVNDRPSKDQNAVKDFASFNSEPTADEKINEKIERLKHMSSFSIDSFFENSRYDVRTNTVKVINKIDFGSAPSDSAATVRNSSCNGFMKELEDILSFTQYREPSDVSTTTNIEKLEAEVFKGQKRLIKLTEPEGKTAVNDTMAAVPFYVQIYRFYKENYLFGILNPGYAREEFEDFENSLSTASGVLRPTGRTALKSQIKSIEKGRLHGAFTSQNIFDDESHRIHSMPPKTNSKTQKPTVKIHSDLVFSTAGGTPTGYSPTSTDEHSGYQRNFMWHTSATFDRKKATDEGLWKRWINRINGAVAFVQFYGDKYRHHSEELDVRVVKEKDSEGKETTRKEPQDPRIRNRHPYQCRCKLCVEEVGMGRLCSSDSRHGECVGPGNYWFCKFDDSDEAESGNHSSRFSILKKRKFYDVVANATSHCTNCEMVYAGGHIEKLLAQSCSENSSSSAKSLSETIQKLADYRYECLLAASSSSLPVKITSPGSRSKINLRLPKIYRCKGHNTSYFITNEKASTEKQMVDFQYDYPFAEMKKMKKIHLQLEWYDAGNYPRKNGAKVVEDVAVVKKTSSVRKKKSDKKIEDEKNNRSSGSHSQSQIRIGLRVTRSKWRDLEGENSREKREKALKFEALNKIATERKSRRTRVKKLIMEKKIEQMKNCWQWINSELTVNFTKLERVKQTMENVTGKSKNEVPKKEDSQGNTDAKKVAEEPPKEGVHASPDADVEKAPSKEADGENAAEPDVNDQDAKQDAGDPDSQKASSSTEAKTTEAAATETTPELHFPPNTALDPLAVPDMFLKCLMFDKTETRIHQQKVEALREKCVRAMAVSGGATPQPAAGMKPMTFEDLIFGRTKLQLYLVCNEEGGTGLGAISTLDEAAAAEKCKINIAQSEEIDLSYDSKDKDNIYNGIFGCNTKIGIISSLKKVFKMYDPRTKKHIFNCTIDFKSQFTGRFAQKTDVYVDKVLNIEKLESAYREAVEKATKEDDTTSCLAVVEATYSTFKTLKKLIEEGNFHGHDGNVAPGTTWKTKFLRWEDRHIPTPELKDDFDSWPVAEVVGLTPEGEPLPAAQRKFPPKDVADEELLSKLANYTEADIESFKHPGIGQIYQCFHGDPARSNSFWKYASHRKMITLRWDTHFEPVEDLFCTNCSMVPFTVKKICT